MTSYIDFSPRTVLPVFGATIALPLVYNYVSPFFYKPNTESVLAKHFTITHKNVEKIQDANIILIGKNGDYSPHIKVISRLIQSLFNPNDTVLLQEQNGPYTACAPHGTIICEWEDYKERALDNAEKAKLEKLFAVAKGVAISRLSDAEWLEQMRTLVKLHPSYKEQKEAELAQDRFNTDDKELLLKVLINSLSCAWDRITPRNDSLESLKQRNISILRCIALSKSQKTFVIADEKHFIYRFMSGTNAAVDIVHNSLRDKKYMILKPKKTTFGERIKEEWSSSWLGKAKVIHQVITVGILILVCAPFYAFYFYLLKEKTISLKATINSWGLSADDKLKAEPWLIKYCN